MAFKANAITSLPVEVLGEELVVDRYMAEGDQLVLFISPGMGLPERVSQVSAGVADLGIEFWHIDLAENLFLPKSTSTFRGLDGSFVAGLIDKAYELTGKNVTVMTHAYASLPVLRGIRKWQLQNASLPSQSNSLYLNGVILLSPDLYIEVPDLGLDPVFDPISSASNIPVMIFQSGSRGNRWQLDKLITELQKGGAQVFSKIFPGVAGIFYGEDIAPETLDLIKSLPGEIERASHLLSHLPTPVIAQPVLEKKIISQEAMLDMTLKPFKGNPVPPGLDLFSVRGDRVIHNDYTGKVTLVNFWASWCGPCIEEIPSLNRLREQMKGRPFELISVDYAEDKSDILKFMQEVDVNFPVLLDSNGKVSAQWNVLVYPSTFVIAPDGKIVYGVKGGIHWDTPELVEKIRALMKKKSY
ncbi:MAG: TlpA disulfide reductase family protein [Pseudomonadota bacterium]|nr:TlpA disulfide reductase family protein [Pseudomonadota bacterium]